MSATCSPFEGINLKDPAFGKDFFSRLSVEGEEQVLSWQKEKDETFSVRTSYGVFYLKKHFIADGTVFSLSWDRSGVMPEKMVITPLVIPAFQLDHAFFCGEKMGRCLTALFPVKEKEERFFEGRYYSALTYEKVTWMMTTALKQRYDNFFRGTASGHFMKEWRIDFEFLHNDLPSHVELDPVTLQWGNGLEILEAYAENNTSVRRDWNTPPEYGWNSWDYYRWTISEDEVMKNAEVIASDSVLKHYVKRIIIDDGWQHCYGEWEPNHRFPSGMKKLASRLNRLGFKAGLWLAPSIVEPAARIAQMDYDMLACSEGGQPCLGYRCMERLGFLLDPTVRKTQDFLFDLFDRYASMGYSYFKLDFLSSTMEAKRFRDRSVPRCRILDLLMEPIVRGVASRAELLGCNYPFYCGSGPVSAVRVGGDIHSRWDSIKHNTVHVAGLFWANKRLWINDGDFALCRNPETSCDPDLARLKACYVSCRPDSAFNEDFEYELVDTAYHEQLVLLSLVLINGGAVNLSDNMALLNEKGLELARKVVSAEWGFDCKVLDLFERELPVYWTQKLSRGGRVLVINWSDRDAQIPVDWERIAPHVREVRDFWSSEVEMPSSRVILRAHSCKLWEY